MLYGRYQVTWKHIHLHIIQYFTLVPNTWGIKQRTKRCWADGKPPTQRSGRWADQTWVARQSPGAAVRRDGCSLGITGQDWRPRGPQTGNDWHVHFCLVVWNMFFFHIIYWGFNNPNWLIFFRGVAQPPTRFLVLSIQWSGYPIWSHTHLAISKNWNIPKQPDTIGIPTEKHVQKLEWFWGHAFKNPLYQILYIIYIWYLKMFTWFDFYST